MLTQPAPAALSPPCSKLLQEPAAAAAPAPAVDDVTAPAPAPVADDAAVAGPVPDYSSMPPGGVSTKANLIQSLGSAAVDLATVRPCVAPRQAGAH